MSRAIWTALAVLAVSSAHAQEDTIRQAASFISPTKDRIFIARLNDGATEEDARTFAAARDYTVRRMTAVYFYVPEATMPDEGLASARSVSEANAALDDPKMSAWRYAFMHYKTGASEFVDCSEPNDLCR